MNQPRASRLSFSRWDRFLAKPLPPGTRKRKLVFGIGIPLIILLALLGIFDKIVMPAVTRQGSEFALPELKDRKLVDAELMLQDLDLSHEIASREYAPGKEAGTILEQYPKAGTMVKSGRAVKLVVSLGEKFIPVPNVAGKSVRQAMLDLETVGLKVGEIAWAFSDTIPERVVVFSYPAEGTEVSMGGHVNLMVNRGRASTFTYVPSLVGITLDQARRRLEEKSLTVGDVEYRRDDNFLPETVLEQSEPEGTELDVGTPVDLIVSKS